MSCVSALGTEFFCELGAFGEGAIGVAVRMIGLGLQVMLAMCFHARWEQSCIVGLSRAVRGMAALGCDLAKLVLREVGKVGRVGGRHYV